MSAKLFTVNNKADSAEILISGPIGGSWWDESGMTEKAFLDALKEIPKGKPLVVGINSEGGSIQDGLGIYNAIKRWEGPTTARIDGYAVSIASVIPLAAQRVISPKSSIWMIHEPWMVAQGNAEDMRKAASVLEKHGETLASIYESETGMSADEVRSKMKEETWFRGDEAVTMGFADESPDGAVAFNALDATKFRNVPDEILNAILAPAAATTIKPSEAGKAGTEQARTLSEAKKAEESKQKTAVTTAKNQNSMEENKTTVAAENAATKTANSLDLGPVVARLEAIENKLNAPAPAARQHIENLGNPLVEKYNSLICEPEARAKMAKFQYNDLRKQLMIANSVKINELGANYDRFNFANPDIRNANTVDAALANTILSGDFVTTMRTYIAPWAAFTRRVELSPVSRRQTLEVPLASSAGSKQQNATNYETGDSVMAPIAVTVAEESKSFHVSRPETNLGLQLAALVPTNAKVLAEGIHAKMTALMTNANFGADVVIGTAANFDSGDLPAILALGKNYDSVRLLLDGGHLAYLLPTTRESFVFGEPGAYGFDGGIYKNNLWTSAATDICGLVCGPDAIVNAWGMADGLPSGEAISQSTVDVNGIPFGLSVWFSRASRAVWASFQVMHGCAVGDATQAEVLTTQ